MKELLHQPEDIIAQRYRILDTLGQGGSGTTYLAEDVQSGEQVALKVLSLRHMSDWKAIALFEREAQVLAQLNHPAIPRYLEYFHVDTATDRCFYIAQQLAQGQSLFTLVENGWHTSEEQVRHIAIQILSILVYLHELTPPVIHRDIKPHNIILSTPPHPSSPPDQGYCVHTSPEQPQNAAFRPPSPQPPHPPNKGGRRGGTGTSKSPRIGGFRGQDRLIHKSEDLYVHRSSDQGERTKTSPQLCNSWGGQVFLVDFGAVQNTYHSTFARSSTVVGTFGYMAPEQFIGQAVPATDLYSLGATLLFLLTHRSPAELPTDGLKLDFRSRVEISDEFADWLEKMLQPDVEERFSSAKEALAVLQGKQIIAGKSRKSSRRKHLVKFGIASVAALAVFYHLRYPILASIGIVPTKMYVAATWGDVDTVRHYLEQGVSANTRYIRRDTNGGTLLHFAGSKEVAQLLIAHGADVNAKDDWGQTPLHTTRSLEVAQLLITHGADVNAKDEYGSTPLDTTLPPEIEQLLIAQGADVHAKNDWATTPLHQTRSPEAAKLLIAHGADVNAKDNYGTTPLHLTRSPEVAQLLIAKGADVNAKDKDSKTPLHSAVESYTSFTRFDMKDLVELLLAKGAKVNAKDNEGKTPLLLTQSAQVAKILIDNGADINAKDKRGRTPKPWAESPLLAQLVIGKDSDLDVNARNKEGKTLLYLAAENGWKDKVELLLAKGADVNATYTYKNGYRPDGTPDGGTPLHVTRLPEVARLLIAKGANVNARNQSGDTPLHVTQSLDVAQVLIANGADVNAKDTQGRTPLDTVLTAPWYINNKVLVELLIAKGADVNARDKDGETPLHKVNSLEVAKILIAHGASLNARDNWGNTPLHLTADPLYGSSEVARLLFSKGADVNAKNNAGQTPVEVVTNNICTRSFGGAWCD